MTNLRSPFLDSDFSSFLGPFSIRYKKRMISTVDSFHHITNEVSSVEKTRDFYVKVFGFEEVNRPNLGCQGAWLEGLGLHLHIIEAHDLEEYERRKALRLREFTKQVPFVDHFAFLVRDLDSIEESLIASGVRHLHLVSFPLDFNITHMLFVHQRLRYP